METPSSTRRVTRSQALASLNSNNKILVSKSIEDSGKALSKSRQRNAKQQDRSALVDITNDSPIVGLATGNLETPLSSIAKQKGSRVNNTPGSGEALLRSQVKTLLQKVEEEAELSKLSLESRPFSQLVNSPMALFAPTPANTPQISNLSADGCGNNSAGLALVTSCPMVEEEGLASQAMNHVYDGMNQESAESEKSLTRSLFLDFSEKSEVSDESECCLSELSYQEVVQGGCKEKDDEVSIWSIQVNASTDDEDEEEVAEEDVEEEEEKYYEDIEEEEDGGLLAELCEGLNNISVKTRVAPKFAGKHTRFVYNSDDELDEEKEEDSVSPNVLHLKGLPTPKGKHLRFPEEQEE